MYLNEIMLSVSVYVYTLYFQVDNIWTKSSSLPPSLKGVIVTRLLCTYILTLEEVTIKCLLFKVLFWVLEIDKS